MTRTLLVAVSIAVCGAGCITPNFTNWLEEPTDRELAAMVNRRAAFGESPYGPYGAPSADELARVKARERLARDDWMGTVGPWAGMSADDPAWAGDPHARVPEQAQWLTAIEAKVIATQPWERGAVISSTLRLHWMRDQENRAAILNNIQEGRRARRAPYGGFATDYTPAHDSLEAEDGLPGLTTHERHAWRIHWGYAHHWWTRDARPVLVRNRAAPSGPVTNSPEGDGTFFPMLQGAGEATRAKKDAEPTPKPTPQPTKKPAKKKGDF